MTDYQQEELTKAIKTIFNGRIQSLESENNLLKSDLSKLATANSKQALEYYMRLRTDLYSEVIELRNSLTETKAASQSESAALHQSLEEMQEQLSALHKENSNLQSQNAELISHLKEKEEMLNQRTNVQLKKNPNGERTESLENQLALLNKDLDKKEFLIKDQKEAIDELQMQLEMQHKDLNEQVESWKSKYETLLAPAQTNEDTFDQIFAQRMESYRNNMEETKYQLEKKLLLVQDALKRKDKEGLTIKGNYEATLEAKEREISSLKESLSEIQKHFELIFTLSVENVNKIYENFGKLKQIYLSREEAFVNDAKFYVDTMNQYQRILKEKETNNTEIEKEFHSGNTKLLELQNEFDKLKETMYSEKLTCLEESKKSNAELEEKNKALLTQLTNVGKDTTEIKKNIKTLKDLYEISIEKSKLVDNLQRENAELKQKISNLETSKKAIYGDDNSKDKEIQELKVQIKKLETDNIPKDEELKHFREMFENELEEANQEPELNLEARKRIVAEIRNLKEQMAKLEESKNEMNKFYDQEIKSLNEKIISQNAYNSNGINLDSANENKKADVISSWQDEITQIQYALNSAENVADLIGTFTKSCNDLKNVSKDLINATVQGLKNQIAAKDETIKQLTLKLQVAEKSQSKSLDDAKKLFYSKVNVYKNLLEKRKNEDNILDTHSKFIYDLSQKIKNDNDNEMRIFQEQNEKLSSVIETLNANKQTYGDILKKEIAELQNKLNQKNESYIKNIQEIKLNNEEQLKLIKDREEFIMKQNEFIRHNFTEELQDKQKNIDALKQENEQLKNKNVILKKSSVVIE